MRSYLLRRMQVDALDPGTCLMWIFGSLLLLFWLMFAFYGDLFDRVRTLPRSPCVLRLVQEDNLQTRILLIGCTCRATA